MKIVVQKFGGTSVATPERRSLLIDKVKKAIDRGELPVVVVSAMGRKGDPYATDTLLSQINPKLKTEQPRSVDMLMSCGEIISSVVTSSEMLMKGINAIPLTGGQAGIITDENFMEADFITVDTENIKSLLKEGKVPVIAGFQGRTKKWDITTIGRGGSDVTASLIGAYLKADRVEIYTDVDGILTSDPNIVPNASLIKTISYEESFQFAYEGAKVIHPRAVEIAQNHNLPLLIKNTLSNSEGTLINNDIYLDKKRIITGIASKSDRVQVTVEYEGDESYYSMFTILGEHDISLDLINVFPKQKIFTIDSDKLTQLKEIFNNMNLKFEYKKNCCKIALIGAGMRGTPGVMARILTALTREKIEVLQTADSHNTIWCLVNEKDRDKSIIALHKEFQL
ncbi:aspartate kinase [Oceanirhabdus sp. W0125-5]|uniref:aspartate kinase n=1 Tax=Oceanirhabdus sp. W0125-5 TaxID=2999116 RepID=UPI0022F2B8C3|nr:aspartate kinase [Oceanirhabdus sp. W0125-5]WBW94843.1 aspartate kinase [Oceanirhabdus sp. W0125-5]